MAKTTPLEFLRQVREEVRRVSWPSRKETTVTTSMVLVMVAVAALFFFGVDWVLANVFEPYILGIGR